MKLLIIILMIYLGFKVIGKYIFPMFVNRVMNKFEERVRNQQQQQAPRPNEKVGETVIDKKPNATKKSNNDVGEYVDYEDVEE